VVDTDVSESVTVAVKSKDVFMGTSVVEVGVTVTPVTVAAVLEPLLFAPQAEVNSAAMNAAARRTSAEIFFPISGVAITSAMLSEPSHPPSRAQGFYFIPT